MDYVFWFPRPDVFVCFTTQVLHLPGWFRTTGICTNSSRGTIPNRMSRIFCLRLRVCPWMTGKCRSHGSSHRLMNNAMRKLRQPSCCVMPSLPRSCVKPGASGFSYRDGANGVWTTVYTDRRQRRLEMPVSLPRPARRRLMYGCRPMLTNPPTKTTTRMTVSVYMPVSFVRFLDERLIRKRELEARSPFLGPLGDV